MIGVEEGVTPGKREWEGEGTDRVSFNEAEPPKQMKLKLNIACMPTYPLRALISPIKKS